MNDWKQAKDGNGRVYYYNLKTKKSQWEKPTSMVEPTKSAVQHQNMVSDWKTAVTKDGKTYYYNPKTGRSSWTLPENTSHDTSDSKLSTQVEVKTSVNTQKKDSPVSTPETKDLDEDTVAVSSFEESEYNLNSKLINVSVLPKEEAENSFMQMFKENEVDATWSFSKVISELGTSDSRYWLVGDDPLWKQQMFEKYLYSRSKEQLMKEHNETNKFQDAFWSMLASKKEIKYYTRWLTAKRIISEEPIYKHSVVSESLKKASFLEYVQRLRKEKEDEENKLRSVALSELREYLKETIKPDSDYELPMSWQQLVGSYLFEKNKRYMANKHFEVLSRSDVLNEYLGQVSEYEVTLNKKLKDLNDKNYTQDRIARDNFRKLLRDVDFKIRANSRWSDIYPFIKNKNEFTVCLGRNGSTPVDIFYDIVQEQLDIIKAQKSIAQQYLIEKKFAWEQNDEDNIKSITFLLREAEYLKETDTEDVDLIVQQLIKNHREKIQEELKLKERVHEQEKQYFKLMIQGYFRRVKSLPEDWQAAKKELSNTAEYKSIKNDEIRKEIYETTRKELLSSEIIKPAFNNRKRTLNASLELDY